MSVSHVMAVKSPSKSTFLEHNSNLQITGQKENPRLTGIVCTIGPACSDPAILEEMLAAGMTIARLNFSHGTHEFHANLIKNIRIAVENYSKALGRKHPFGIAIDTKGSEIRTGVLDGGMSHEIVLEQGDEITVTTDSSYRTTGTKDIIYVDYKNITKVLLPGHYIYIDDGLISLRVEKITDHQLLCRVHTGGKLGSSKGVNLQGVDKDLPTVSEKDKEDLKFGLNQKVDYIFASFTRNAEEVLEIREILGGSGIQVIAKIENTQGICNMDEIIEAADGILIDRGDLGMEIGTQKVFIAQKVITSKCNRAGKPIIIATHLLESMVDKPHPTRAESCDVANAVLDGADCVMLSGETAKGLYPVECVKTMASLCQHAEGIIWHKNLLQDIISDQKLPLSVVETTAISAVEAALNCFATAIIVVTKYGKTPQLLAKYRPRCPIVAVTAVPEVSRQLLLYRAVQPIILEGSHVLNVTTVVSPGLKSSSMSLLREFAHAVESLQLDS